jgi:hypothetical protein
MSILPEIVQGEPVLVKVSLENVLSILFSAGNARYPMRISPGGADITLNNLSSCLT